jgi:hypothetical protein
VETLNYAIGTTSASMNTYMIKVKILFYINYLKKVGIEGDKIITNCNIKYLVPYEKKKILLINKLIG